MKKITEILKEKNFTLSVELVPPRNGEGKKKILSQIKSLKNKVDFISVTKGAGGSLRGGIAPICVFIKDNGITSIAHFVCREKTKEEIENDIIDLDYFDKKNILALRGSFRPVTKVNMDMFEKSYEMFIKENKVDKDKTQVIFEITLSNLRAEGKIDEQDFMDRARLLCSLGQTVLISNFQEYYKLVEYFSQYTRNRMGLAMGVNNLVDIFDEKYYRHLSGGILEAFGKLFYKDLRVYLYPMENQDGSLTTSENLKVHPRMKELYKFFKYNGKVVDITDFDASNLSVFSRTVLKMIVNGEDGWEGMLPEGVSKLIKEKSLFGWESEEVMHKS